MTLDCAALRQRLMEAEAAYHRLITGAGPQSVSFGPGKGVTYTASNLGALRAYINDLREHIAACCGDATNGTTGRRAPIRFRF